MTYLSDVVKDAGLMNEMLDQKYIKVQIHPEYGYLIYNYTDKAVYDRVWNEATLNCRGLITADDGQVIARGMPKFFNHNQDAAPQFDLDDVVHVADKADGSLGILYPTPEGSYAVATRGSFTSDQAIKATEMLTKNQIENARTFEQAGYSMLVEIIYPANRVVLDYGDTEELRYLGHVHNATGRFTPDKCVCLTPSFGNMTYAEALALPPRENAEGLVLTRDKDGAMLKIKQEDYLILHRIITGLSARTLWQLIMDDKDVDPYIAALPDEFQPWAIEVVRSLEVLVENRLIFIQEDYQAARDDLDELYGYECWTQKDFACKVKEWDDAWAMFALHAGKDIMPELWKRAKPEAFITPVTQRTEDIA